MQTPRNHVFAGRRLRLWLLNLVTNNYTYYIFVSEVFTLLSIEDLWVDLVEEGNSFWERLRSFASHSTLTRPVNANEQKMKTPWRELNIAKRYQKTTKLVARATKPMIQANPIKLEICYESKSSMTFCDEEFVTDDTTVKIPTSFRWPNSRSHF